MKHSKPRGTLEDASEAQLALVRKLKEDLAEQFREYPELRTTWHILRFLRARDFNYAKTRAMLEACFAFRRKKDFGRVAQLDMAGAKVTWLRNNYTSAHYGTDRQGRVVVIEKVSGYSPHIFDFVTNEEMEDYLIQRYERLLFVEFPMSAAAHGRRVDHTFLLVDLQGVDVIKIFNSKLKAIVKIGTYITQDFYPELLGVSFFVNTPIIFKAIWAIIALWLDKKTREKFFFESGNGLKRLGELLDTEQLPQAMGGKNPVPVSENFGVWTEALERSYRDRTFLLADRTPEFQYYYTEEERKEQLLGSEKLPLSGKIVTSSILDLDLIDQTMEIKKIKRSGFRVNLSDRRTPRGDA